jgi:siroheme synthase-like protein
MNYPVTLNLQGKKALVVGAGRVAYRKARHLLRCGAKLTLLAKNFHPLFEKLFREHPGLTRLKKGYLAEDLEGMFLVIAATGDPRTDRDIQQQARKRGVLFSCVDTAIDSDFFVAASITRGDLQVAFSSNGKVPGLSRSLRKKWEPRFPPEWKDFVAFLEKERRRLKKLPPSAKRDTLIRRLSHAEIIDCFETQGLEAVADRIAREGEGS